MISRSGKDHSLLLRGFVDGSYASMCLLNQGCRVSVQRNTDGLLQVSFLKDGDVVRDVSGNDIGERAHGDGIAAGDAGPGPGVGRQVAEERQSSGADSIEIRDMTG